MFLYENRLCYISCRWASNKVSIRFGTPLQWQGEIIVDRKCLVSL